MRRFTLQIVLVMILLFECVSAFAAGGFSYVYMQGDKKTPFYVKFEDQMMPRYGKNYCIIPQLVPGEINVQILFQQNVFPAQKFTIVVPENGFRGFLLIQKDGVFSLYDIHQQFYLLPGNKAEDDRVMPYSSNETYLYKEPSATAATTGSSNAADIRKKAGATPRFLPNIELNNERLVQAAPGNAVSETPTTSIEEYGNERHEPATLSAGNTYVTNSDCPFAMRDSEFEDLYNKVKDKTEKVKLKYLLSKITECYSSNQVRILTEALSNDPEKYTFLKRIYPRVTDQYNFYMLESLLSTQEWKSYFRLILPK